MPAKKSKSAIKGAKKSGAGKRATSPAVPPYGPPIRDAIARGNLTEMKSLAARTRKYVAEVERAVKVLDGKIAKHKG
jgi:hypothetical protein